MAYMIDYEDDWREGYVDLVQKVARAGRVRTSRVGVTMEIRDYMFTLAPEALDLPLGVGRKLHTPLAAAEAIQLCAGVGMPRLTEAAAKDVASFVRDPDGTVHGNYGERVDMQIVDVVDKLKAAPDSRQAVIQIWDKNLDGQFRDPMPRDIPCTLTITFGITGDAMLTMSVSMRSSDVWLGIPYDVFQFRQLQRTIARLVGCSVGQYCHHSVSMHLYDRDLGKASALTVVDVDSNILKDLKADGLHAPRAANLPGVMLAVLGGSGRALAHESHQWYHVRLAKAYASTLG